MIKDAGELGGDLARALESESNRVFDWAVGKGFETRCPKCEGIGERHFDGQPGKLDGYPTVPCPDCGGTGSGYRNFGEQVALVHSEVSELKEAVAGNLGPWAQEQLLTIHKRLSDMLEDHRTGKNSGPDDHCPEFNKDEIEAADIVIRLMCMAGSYGWRLGRAVEAKIAYNYSRPPKHGKKY